MSLLKDLTYWQEPMTGGVSVEYLPVDYSCDNGIVFTAEKVALTETGGPVPWFDYFLLQHEKSPGELLRHPTSSEVTTWDCHLSAASQSTWMARRILAFGEKNRWTWGGKWLGRFPIFIPTVRAKAMDPNKPFRFYHALLASLAYIVNMFEKHQETSGKLLLWLAMTALYGKSWYLDLIIRLWAYVQSKRYKGGLREVMGIYFPPKPSGKKEITEDGDIVEYRVPHPFSVYAPASFDIKRLLTAAFVEPLPPGAA